MLCLHFLTIILAYVLSSVGAGPTCDSATRLSYAQQVVKSGFTSNPVESAAIIGAVPIAPNATFRGQVLSALFSMARADGAQEPSFRVLNNAVGLVDVAVNDVSYRLIWVGPSTFLELRSTPTFQSNPNGTVSSFFVAASPPVT